MKQNLKYQNSTYSSGTEPYDKHYGLGYETDHDNFSPYPRINRLRNQFFQREFYIDLQRARLITEIYQKYPDLSPMMKTALSLQHILEHVEIQLYPEELIVGEIAAPAKAAPLYPEFSADWIREEVLNHPFHLREHDKFYLRKDDEQELLSILAFWKGKTLADEIEKGMTEEEKMGNEMGKKVFLTNLYHYGGIGHYVMDYEILMKKGLKKLQMEAEKKLLKLSSMNFQRQKEKMFSCSISTHEKKENPNFPSKDSEFKEQQEFFQAMILSLSASSRYILRYAKLLEETATQETDWKRKQELQAMAKNCNHISEHPPKTMWQALQLWHFVTTIALIESNGHSVSYGRMDQWLYPYYKKDLETGTITKDFALELLECTYIKMGNPSKLKDRMTIKVRNGRGWGGESLTIGGVDEKGKDATNDLTFLLLEASVHTRMMNPWICVRLHENTPYELKVKAVECIRAGYGHPKLFNDIPAIEAMQRKGMSLSEARNYAVVGCVEPDLPGKEYGYHDAAYLNIAKVMELSLNEGKCIDCSSDCPIFEKCVSLGKTLGPNTGSLSNFKNIQEVTDSFFTQLTFWADKIQHSTNRIETVHKKLKPLPFASTFFADCLENGKDLNNGGAKYNFTGPQASGIGTCADILSVISQLVFDEKKYTGQDLLDAIKNNWENHEILYALVNSSNVHHYGNDDDYADKFFQQVFERYCHIIADRENTRNGYYCPGVYTVNANVGLGLNLSASLDGRKKGEPISDNMGPVHTARSSHDRMGPTAIANSVTKVDHSLATNGTLLNWKFPPECVEGVEGRDNLISFIDTFFAKKAMHCQFNIMSSAMMKDAMKHPEKYKDMLVRVAGYSAYFVELSRPLQMDLIQRTELSF